MEGYCIVNKSTAFVKEGTIVYSLGNYNVEDEEWCNCRVLFAEELGIINLHTCGGLTPNRDGIRIYEGNLTKLPDSTYYEKRFIYQHEEYGVAVDDGYRGGGGGGKPYFCYNLSNVDTDSAGNHAIYTKFNVKNSIKGIWSGAQHIDSMLEGEQRKQNREEVITFANEVKSTKKVFKMTRKKIKIY